LKKAALPLAVGCLVMGALSACGGGGTASPATATTGGVSTGTAQTGSQELTIVAVDNKFEPKMYTVQGGGPLHLVATNSGQNVHEIEVKGLLPESKLSPGQSKTVDLQSVQPGTYRVYCEIHEDEGMEGELVVK
jgi:plastocyanin